MKYILDVYDGFWVDFHLRGDMTFYECKEFKLDETIKTFLTS